MPHIKKPWTQSATCASGRACEKCRAQTPDGERFRAGLATQFALPTDATNFVCPPECGAKPWGFKWPEGKLPKVKGLGGMIGRVTTFLRIKPCGKCDEREKKLDGGE